MTVLDEDLVSLLAAAWLFRIMVESGGQSQDA